MKRGQIKYYQQAGNVCYLKGITDLRPTSTLDDIRIMNEAQAYIGRTHFQITLPSGEESHLTPLKGE